MTMALFGDLGGTQCLHLEQSFPPTMVPAVERNLNPKLPQAPALVIHGLSLFQRSPHLASKIDWQSQFISSELIPFGTQGTRCQCQESIAPRLQEKELLPLQFTLQEEPSDLLKSQVSIANSSQDPQACRLHASGRFPASNSLPAGVGVRVLGRVPFLLPLPSGPWLGSGQ